MLTKMFIRRVMRTTTTSDFTTCSVNLEKVPLVFSCLTSVSITLRLEHFPIWACHVDESSSLDTFMTGFCRLGFPYNH